MSLGAMHNTMPWAPFVLSMRFGCDVSRNETGKHLQLAGPAYTALLRLDTIVAAWPAGGAGGSWPSYRCSRLNELARKSCGAFNMK